MNESRKKRKSVLQLLFRMHSPLIFNVILVTKILHTVTVNTNWLNPGTYY